MILAYIISNSADEAEEISIDLLEKKLAYSVNIFQDVKSMRIENDKVVTLKRTIVLAKTKALLYNELEEEVKRVQTTGTVIVFSMPITQLSDELFKNIQQSTIKV